SSFTFAANQSRAFSQVSVQATRCAPFSSLVRARSSCNSATVRLGLRLIGVQLEINWLALKHLATAALADKLAVADLDFAAHGYDRRAAFDLHALETIVVVIDVLRFRGDHATVIRIVNHQVGIAAHGDRALAGEKPKKFRGARAGRVDKAVQIQASAFYTMRIEQIDAILDSGNAVGNVDERILAQEFLLRV